MVDYDVLHEDVIRLLRVRGDPVGFKFYRERKVGLPYLKRSLALCQVLRLVAIYGHVLGVNGDLIDTYVIGNYVLGFKDLPPDISERWVKYRAMSEEVFKAMISAMHRLRVGEYQSAIFAPLKHFKKLGEDPDGVVLLVNSTQAYLLLSSYFDVVGKKPTSDFNGHAACEIIATVTQGKSPWLTIPCGGARSLAGVEDDELWIGMKARDLEVVIRDSRRLDNATPTNIPSTLDATNQGTPTNVAHI